MDFNSHKPIYLQICTQMYEKILSGELKTDERILSVRELGVQLGVNPNTIMRSYETMQNMGIIYNRRGIGYFIAEGAREAILKLMKKEFMNDELPELVRKMKLLGVQLSELEQMFKTE